MTRIEKVVKEVSDLREFYLKIRKRKKRVASGYSKKSSTMIVEEEKPQNRNSN